MNGRAMSSTRRRFLTHAGAALSVPLAWSTAKAAGHDADGAAVLARLARLEDENAIRELLRTYARHLTAGARDDAALLFAGPAGARIDASVRGLSLDNLGEHDVIDVAPDRCTAEARMHCTVHSETAIGPNCTLVDMARQQGEGYLRSSARRLLETRFVRQDGAWKIESMA